MLLTSILDGVGIDHFKQTLADRVTVLVGPSGVGKTSLLNAIHWVVGEPQCDAERIGLWGSSYSGGHVVYAAARDPRVKDVYLGQTRRG